MATKFYRLNFGMKQHPQSFADRGFEELKPGQLYPGGYKNLKDFQLLYSGDVFACEETLIEKPKEVGGWQDRKEVERDGLTQIHYEMDVATVLPGWAEGEVWVMRDETSQIIGVNISEQEFARRAAIAGAESSVVHPVGSSAANAPASVRDTGQSPARVRRT